ncbi:YciI family protein [Gryllotalpicola ginsengisoli]|uniref:YciI family protein n=1 Tax=Gryllotalpicola ginsengisoli TaxID=444608 RepID=UPI0003B5D1F1|nr:YciI family protein [Gryllotalpicola ginsengisoli]
MTDATTHYLLLYTDAPDGEPWSEESDDIADWLESVADGIRITGERLTGATEARRITKRAGEVTQVDGPFPEFKEWFAGFDLVAAPDLETASEIGSRHPCARFGRVYVLPLRHVLQPNELLLATVRARGSAAV